MSEMEVSEVEELLDRISYRADLHPRVEGEWFQLTFKDDGTEYELSVHLYRGIVALYDSERGEEVFRVD